MFVEEFETPLRKYSKLPSQQVRRPPTRAPSESTAQLLKYSRFRGTRSFTNQNKGVERSQTPTKVDSMRSARCKKKKKKKKKR
jgi:hypothetical protein